MHIIELILRIKEFEDYGGRDSMNYEQIKEQRLELIRSYAKKIWKQIDFEEISNYKTWFNERGEPNPIIPIPWEVNPFAYRHELPIKVAVGTIMSSIIIFCISSSTIGAGAYAPIPPVFGPLSPS